MDGAAILKAEKTKDANSALHNGRIGRGVSQCGIETLNDNNVELAGRTHLRNAPSFLCSLSLVVSGSYGSITSGVRVWCEMKGRIFF